MINFFELLKVVGKELDPTKCKVHFACYNGIEDPYEDVFLLGKWKEWQEGQTKKNFTRSLIVSLIQLRPRNLWMFAGVYKCNGIARESEALYHYSTDEIIDYSSIVGRAVVDYDKTFRNSYPYGESIANEAMIHQILPAKVCMKRFDGYGSVRLRYAELCLIVNEAIEGWLAPLSAVAGVYLITDTNNGKLYVGSAYGGGGIMERWRLYAQCGHGGNVKLKERLSAVPEARNGFEFSILETVDISASNDYIIQRESLWKDRLGSRINGYNEN